MSNKSHLWRGLAGLSTSLLCIMFAADNLCFGFLEHYVNDFLGTSNVKTVTNEDGETDTTYYKSEYDSVTELVEARDAMNERVVEEGAVLLKNDNNSLPLSSNPSITFLGMESHQAMYDICSGAAAIGNDDQIVTYEEAFQDRGINLNPTMIDFYSQHESEYTPGGPGGVWGGSARYSIGEMDPDTYWDSVKSSFDGYDDAAVIFIERNMGEGYDFLFELDDRETGTTNSWITADLETGSDGEHDSLQLQNRERRLIELAEEEFDNVIVFINSSNPIECHDLQEDPDVDAVLWTGAVGTRGAYGIADLLLGNESPSGGLVDTYATDNHSAPAMMNYGHYEFSNSADIENTSYGLYYIVEAEGVYVGYKYYETRYEDAVIGQGNASSSAGTYASEGNQWDYADEVVYPFGYGLSYTTFSEEITGHRWDGDQYVVDVNVTNTGNVAGKDNVQLYFQSPYTSYDVTNNVEKPFTFIGCMKTDELQPGASQTVEISVDEELLMSYDYTNEEAYILEDGEYWFSIGDGAHEAVNNMLGAMGYTNLVDEQGNAYTAESNSAFKDTFSSDVKDEGADGYKIYNRFEDYSDLNSYQPGTVTYLSRSDWNGTYPKSYDGIEAKGVSPDGVDMFAELNGDTYVADPDATIDFEYGNPNNTNYTAASMIGESDWYSDGWDLLLDQMDLYDYSIMSLSTAISSENAYNISWPGYTGNEGPTGNAVGFCTQADHEATNTPYYMTAEEEADPYLSTYNCSSMHQQCMLAATFSPELAYEMGEIFGEDTLWSHCTAMEIGVNNHRTAYSGRNCEYYSECGNLSYIMGEQECNGMQSKGAACMPKHIFGNDQETHRQGLATFANEQAMREIQLRGTEGALYKGQAQKSMTSFSRYGVIQSAYCTGMFEVIRGEWGNVCNVDMTDMAFNDLMYGQRSVVAGTTTFCSFVYAPGNSMSYSDILNGDTLAANPEVATAMREAAKRQLYVWANSNDANGYSSNTSFVSVTPWWQPTLITITVIFGVAAAAFITLYVIYDVRKPKEAN